MNINKVKFEPMNKIHQNEVKLLDTLLNAIENNECYSPLYDEFLEDVKNHFSFEEDLMQKYDFFAYIPHKMEHDRIINELTEIKEKDRKFLIKYFEEIFIPWLDNHINTIDTVTAGYFDMIGLNKEFN